ncbi:MAG: hypothetical protein ACYDH5_00520 [Acidimicrobiales bacterium]
MIEAMGAAGGGMTFEESARALGRLRFIELEMFVVLGRLVQPFPDPPAKPFLSAHSTYHAFRAGLLEEVLPVSGPLQGEDIVRPSGPAEAVMLARLAGAARVAGSAEPPAAVPPVAVLAGVQRVVLPRLAAGYRRYREAASQVSDAPAARVAGVAASDLASQWAEGKDLLTRLLSSPEMALACAGFSGELEALAAGAFP